MTLGLRIGKSGMHIGSPTSVLPPLLVIASGQSNQLGKMQAVNVGLSAADSRVTMYDHNAGSFANPPTFHDNGGASRALSPRTEAFNGYLIGDAGVEVQAGRDLATAYPGRRIYWAKMCIDGSSLITGWNNPAYPAGGPALLTQWSTFIAARIAEYEIANPAEQMILSWNQGEADTGAAYATYLAALQNRVTTLQGMFGNFRVIVHRVTSKNDGSGNVRAALESFAASLGTRGTVSYGDDLALRDAAHYTDAAYVTVGQRQSAAMIAMLNGTTSASPVWKVGGPPTIASSTQSATPTLPLHQAGDVFLMVLSGLGQNNYTLSSAQGFTEISGSPQHDSGSSLNARLQVWWKRAASSSETAPTIADAASDDSKLVTVLLIRGCRSTGNPFDDTAGNTAASSTSVSVPGLTTTVNNALVLAICTHRLDNVTLQQFSAWVNSDLANLTWQMDLSTSSGAGFGLGIVSGTKATAGTVGTTTATLAAASTQARLCIALAS